MTKPDPAENPLDALVEFFNELARIDHAPVPLVPDDISVEDAQKMAADRLAQLRDLGLNEIKNGNMDRAMKIAESTMTASLKLMVRYGVVDISHLNAMGMAVVPPADPVIDPKDLN